MNNVLITRMHGCGNQFLLIQERAVQEEAYYGELSVHLATQYSFDQLLVLQQKKEGFTFLIINREGSVGKQCLNGARCVAHYLVTKKLVIPPSFVIANVSGSIPVIFTDPSSIQLTLPMPRCMPAVENAIGVDVGNPHVIFFVDSVTQVNVEDRGRSMQSLFTDGINVGFVECIDRTHIRLRTYERGCGETAACGSSALASVFAGMLTDLLAETVRVSFGLNNYFLSIKKIKNGMQMIGPSHLDDEFFIIA